MPNINSLLAELDNARRMLGVNAMNIVRDPLGQLSRSASRYAEENLPSQADVTDAMSVMPGMGDAAASKINALATNFGGAGIFAGGGAKTADWNKLYQAINMESKAADRQSILGETGWFRGPEGRWRFEIPDNNADVPLHRILGVGEADRNIPMSGAVVHPEIYQAYPELNSIKATLARPNFTDWANSRLSGFYDPDRREMSIATPTSTQALSTGLHELQHAVQQLEGFRFGGNPRTARSVVARPVPEHYKAVQEALTLQQAFGNARTLNPSATMDDVIARLRPNPLSADIAKKFPTTDLNYVLERARGIRDLKPMDAYRRLAGEAEARAVQNRIPLTAEERVSSPNYPWTVGPRGYDTPWQELFTDYQSY